MSVGNFLRRTVEERAGSGSGLAIGKQPDWLISKVVAVSGEGCAAGVDIARAVVVAMDATAVLREVRQRRHARSGRGVAAAARAKRERREYRHRQSEKDLSNVDAVPLSSFLVLERDSFRRMNAGNRSGLGRSGN